MNTKKLKTFCGTAFKKYYRFHMHLFNICISHIFKFSKIVIYFIPDPSFSFDCHFFSFCDCLMFFSFIAALCPSVKRIKFPDIVNWSRFSDSLWIDFLIYIYILHNVIAKDSYGYCRYLLVLAQLCFQDIENVFLHILEAKFHRN